MELVPIGSVNCRWGRAIVFMLSDGAAIYRTLTYCICQKQQAQISTFYLIIGCVGDVVGLSNLHLTKKTC